MEPGHTDVTVCRGDSPEVVVGHATDQCRAVGGILARIGDKWGVLAAVSPADGTFLFNELKRHLATNVDADVARSGAGRARRTHVPSHHPIQGQLRTCRAWRSLREPVGALGQCAIDHRGTVELPRDPYDRGS